MKREWIGFCCFSWFVKKKRNFQEKGKIFSDFKKGKFKERRWKGILITKRNLIRKGNFWITKKKKKSNTCF